MLSNQTVIKLASVLRLEDEAFIVGGQALNLWAERYAATNDALAEYGPFTSKDLDYFGHREAAIKLAEGLEGTVSFPMEGDHTPSVAKVQAKIGDDWVEIDFIRNVIGVDPGPLEKWAVELVIPIGVNNGTGVMNIPVMHPLHCLQSRVANVTRLHRQTPLALNQMGAAPHVVSSYVNEMLAAGDHREASQTLNGLFRFLTRDIEGRKAPRHLVVDIVDVFRRFHGDSRFDLRYRTFNLTGIIARLQLRTLLPDRLPPDED